MVIDLERLFALSQHAGYLSVGHPVVIAEVEDQTLLERQFQHGLLETHPEQCAAAAAMALGNLLGLVCDPVAGLVEVPCIKRNVVGAVNAVSCANMALAGVDYAIPCDEVIDAMGRVGSLLSPDLRETGQGGLAATPTGVKIARQLAQED